MFCNKAVFGANGVTVQNKGVAHKECLEANKALRRQFRNIDISALSDQELTDLKDLILAEENSRKSGSDDDIELF